ncbi:MAG: OB-fold nucleic acid binding domain-containing protein [Brooklawnia sp.]|nr:OB-fold nucleic acid binding domain-containing protein [Brooklawnia sp.]
MILRRPGWLRRLLSSHQQLVADEREQEAVVAGATPIRDLQPHTVGTVQGTVSMLTLNPRGGGAWLETELHDGTGTLKLIWMGRRVIPGIIPGVKMRVEGRITLHEGSPTIFNPAYELVA